MPAETKSLSLKDIYIDHLKDLYSAETQIVEVLPAIIEKLGTQTVKQGLEEHLKENMKQIERLDQIFQVLHQDPRGKNVWAWRVFCRRK